MVRPGLSLSKRMFLKKLLQDGVVVEDRVWDGTRCFLATTVVSEGKGTGCFLVATVVASGCCLAATVVA